MRSVYIDGDYKCHVQNEGTMESVETDFFDGKCDAFVEGYRLVPFGKVWTRSDGVVFHGEMIAPFKDYDILKAHQELYEKTYKATEADYQKALAEFGVKV